MKKLLLTLFSVLMFAATASAQIQWTEIKIENPDEPSTLHLKTKTNYLVLHATMTTVFHMNVAWTNITLFECDAAGNAADQLVPHTTDYNPATNKGRTYNLPVEEGKTYYFITGSIASEADVQVYYGEAGVQEMPITITSEAYQNGDTYTVTSKNFELAFDRAVSVDETIISYMQDEDGVYKVDKPVASTYISSTMTSAGYFYVIELNKIVQQMIDEGDIRPGEKFKITLKGIADQADEETIYGEDGVYTLELVLGEPAAELVSINPANGSTLYTYYPEGGENGLLCFTFTDDIDPECNPTVTCSYGDMEAGSYANMKLPYTIEGNTVTADIRGIFFPEIVASSRGEDQATNITISLKGLRTVDGRDVQTNYIGAGTTAVMAIYPLEKEDVTLIMDTEPYAQSSIKDLKEIMLWVSDVNSLLSFDNVQFSWETSRGIETKTINAEDIKFEYNDLYRGYTAMIPLTGVLKSASNIKLTINGAVLRNGEEFTWQTVFNVPPTGIDGVEAGEDADEVVKVYTIGGTLVKECKRGEAANGLAKGIYIIGGKKLVVR